MRRDKKVAALLAACLCVAPAAAMRVALAETTVIEAEDARIVAPASIMEAHDARGGRAVRINSETSLVRMSIRDTIDPLHSAVTAERGEMGFEFSTTQAGEYAVWVRLQWHCPCSPYLNIRTSGRYLGSPGDDVATGLLTSSARPLVWHWVNAGTYAFDSGMQEVRLVQRGHLSLIDAVAVSNEAGYRPPGFQDSAQAFQLAELPETWRPPAEGETVVQSFCDREWTDFSLEVAFPLDEAQRQFALEFCACDAGSYRLVFDRAGERVVASLVKRVHGGTEALLAERVRADARDVWHVVRLERVRKGIEVLLDATEVLAVEDDSFPSGRCGLCITSLQTLQFRDLTIRPIRFYEDYFAGEAVNWHPLAGTWRVAVESGSPCYVGHGGERALSVAPWRTDSPYRLAASVRLLGAGTAGIAFDIADANNYAALALCGRASGETVLQLEAVENGAGRELWSQPSTLAPGQWVFLEVEKKGDTAWVSADGQRVAAVEWPSRPDEDAVGLVAGMGGAAQFASAHCREIADTDRFAYVFEPPGGQGALAPWRQSQGCYVLREHPGRLEMMPAAGSRNAVLSWRGALGSPVEVEVVVRPAVDDTPRPKAESLTPDVPVPVLPDDARFGIAFTPEVVPENEIRVSVDLLQMRNLVVRRGREALFNETVPLPAESARRVLEVRLDGALIMASVGDRFDASLPMGEAPMRGTLSLFGENLGDAPVQITRILIRRRPHDLIRFQSAGR